MLESYLITFREGVEIALILGILLVYLKKIHRTGLTKTVYAGFAASMIVSVVIAIILERLAMDFEPLEGYLMFIAAFFVTTMIVWMWKTSKHIKKEIEHRIDNLVTEKQSSVALHLGVFLFTFLMIVREGVETVIFLRAVSSGQGVWGSIIGVAAGMLAAFAFGVLFIKGSLKIDIGKFLKVTAVVLLIFAAQLLINGVHEFYELGVFPANPQAMGIVGPIVRNNLLFVLAIFSIPAIMFIIPPSRRATQPVEATPSSRRWQLASGIITLCVVFFFGFDFVFANRSSVEISAPTPINDEAGIIRVHVSQLLDGNLHRFVWQDGDGTKIRFFAIRTGTSTIGTACDACRACYNYGYYYMNEGELICSMCDAPAELSKLAVATSGDEEQSGSMEGMGCAPLYLPSTIQDGDLIIKVDDLLKNKKYFQTSHDSDAAPPQPSGIIKRSHE